LNPIKPPPSFIASRKLIAIDANGREFAITIGIGTPYEVDPESWACPVLLEGMHERLADQKGVDSWQSIQLAYQLILRLLEYFVQEGGTLHWPEGRETVNLSDLAPVLGHPLG
jgi:hypothetical protein